VLSPELEMAVAFPGMIGLVPVGDLGEEGSGICSQWVEFQAVDDDRCNLMRWLAVSEP
jgi:hypothetical protein